MSVRSTFCSRSRPTNVVHSPHQSTFKHRRARSSDHPLSTGFEQCHIPAVDSGAVLFRLFCTFTPAHTIKELEAGAAQSAEDDADENPLAVLSLTLPAAVPEFWLTVLRTHVGLSKPITDGDAGAFKYLADLRSEYISSSKLKPGFKLIFEVLSSEYEVLEET